MSFPKSAMLASAMLTILRPISATPFEVESPHSENFSAIQWAPCELDIEMGFTVECGKLAVPLDYASANCSETLDLKLIRALSNVDEPKGSIFYIPGGPGLSLADPEMFALTVGDVFRFAPSYNIIAFEPRGVGDTLTFSCFEDDHSREKAQLEFPHQWAGAECPSLDEMWMKASAVAATCAKSEQAAAVGDLIGTAYTARDIIQIVDAVEPDGMLRYWGLSYASILAETLVAMFPDRIDKALIEAVPNPHEYYYAWDIQRYTHFDASFSRFFEDCVAHAENCFLAQSYPNSSATELEAAVYSVLDRLKSVPIYHEETVQILDYSKVGSAIRAHLSLQHFQSWDFMAQGLAGLLSSNSTLVAAWVGAFEETPGAAGEGYPPEALDGIRCGDKTVRVTDLDTIMPDIESALNISKAGSGELPHTFMTCGQWPFKAKEVWTDGFENLEPANPILFVNNRYDPITSIEGARNASEGINGSVLLEVNGIGHAGAATTFSVCQLNYIASYFENGTLPDSGTVCDDVFTPFQNTTWADILD